VVPLGNHAKAELILGAVDQDDCAAYRVSGDAVLVAGSDYIRGVGFYLYEQGYLTDYDIGWYLAGANFSDVAAMGALPIALLSVVRYPRDMPDLNFQEIIRGISESCRAVAAFNVGGDIGSAETVILSASALGLVEPDLLLQRSGARPGDLLCLSGATGLAGAAMKLARAGILEDIDEAARVTLLERWRRVRARVPHGRALATSGAATACIDTSDGLKAAVETLSRSSALRIVVERERVPVAPEVALAAKALGVAAEELVFGDSVDFELVASVRPESLARLRDRLEPDGLTLHVIGYCEEGSGALLAEGDARRDLPGVEWRH